MTTEITRREALRRTAWILGGTLAAPTILGVLAGCDRAPATVPFTPRTLTAEQDELVVAITETILPETDTPGARAARVHEFIDAMLTDYYPAPDRARFLAGLARVDARAARRYGTRFVACTAEQQADVLREFDRAAFTATERKSAEGPAPDPAAGDDATHPDDVGEKAFFRTMKELTLVGYYTSELGARQELRVMPMGEFRGDIPFSKDERAWA